MEERDIVIDVKNIEKPDLKNNEKQKPNELPIIPTKDHIRRAIKHANVKYRAIILLISSSGMTSSGIRRLTIKDYLDSLEITKYDLSDVAELIQMLREKESNIIPTWSMRRSKTGLHYFTFSSLQSSHAINDYIDDRIEKKRNFTNDNDYLFESRGGLMDPKTFVSYFTRLNDICGFGSPNGQPLFTSHALRKFFVCNLQYSGFDSLEAKSLLGHNVPKITHKYFKPDIERLKGIYSKALNWLSLGILEARVIESEIDE